MFYGEVQQIKRTWWSIKYKTVYSAVNTRPEPIMAEMSKYHGEWYIKKFVDMTESLGDFRPPPSDAPTAWDAATGEPITDDRSRANYGRGARDQMDPELEDEWAQEMGWMPRAPSAQGVDESMPF